MKNTKERDNRNSMLNFVIQEHWTTPRHFDWMFEIPDEKSERNLMTWSVETNPLEISKDAVECTKLENHRRIYLTYEGEISGGRGSVKIYDSGKYEILFSKDGFYKFSIIGENVKGTYVFESKEKDKWQLYKID